MRKTVESINTPSSTLIFISFRWPMNIACNERKTSQQSEENEVENNTRGKVKEKVYKSMLGNL